MAMKCQVVYLPFFCKEKTFTMRELFKQSGLIYLYFALGLIGLIVFQGCSEDEPSSVSQPMVITPPMTTPETVEEKIIAQLSFDTNGSAPILSKDDYVEGILTIKGLTEEENIMVDARIRGRGNSTWQLPKKPFKIKLNDDASVLGMAPEKDWVLLANYIDGTHLLNAVGMKIGQLLEMPYTNTMIPVEVTINNEYLGLYNLTEQVEVKINRVNVGDDGILLNIDSNFDEEWQFKSESYNLPVSVKYPKEMDTDKLTSIRNQFETLEALVADSDFPNNQYLNYIDDVSIAQYLITYMLTGNEEINHPKSTYLHKTSTGKFVMGPIWDFDWAFAFEGSFDHFSSFNRPLFWTPISKPGSQFFSKLMSDPKIQSLIKEQWSVFKKNDLSELMTYINEYATSIEKAKAKDLALWKNDNKSAASLRLWIQNRVSYMDSFIGNF